MKLELDIDLRLDKEQMEFFTNAIHQIIKTEIKKEIEKSKKELT